MTFGGAILFDNPRRTVEGTFIYDHAVAYGLSWLADRTLSVRAAEFAYLYFEETQAIGRALLNHLSKATEFVGYANGTRRYACTVEAILGFAAGLEVQALNAYSLGEVAKGFVVATILV